MTRQALPPGWKVPEVFRQRLGSSVGRQRLMQAEGQLLLVLHAVPHANETSRTGHYFWKDADGQWHSSQLGSGVGALTKFVAQYDHAIDRVEELEENASQAEDYLNVLEELSPIARSSRNMLLVLEDARNAVSEDVGLIDIRDQAYEASRTAELLYADVKNAMDVAIVRQAERQAAASAKMTQAAHRLNVLAAMFFPAATLGAIFGTTFTDGWESLSNSWMPFGIFVGASFLTGLILVAFINRKVKS